MIFFRDPQLFCALNFRHFFKTHTLTHTGKGPESTGQGQTGIFLSGPVFLPHLLADDPADGVRRVLFHLGRGVSIILWPDFTPADLDAAIEEYRRRHRRFGGI